jgi:hypothetical protein
MIRLSWSSTWGCGRLSKEEGGDAQRDRWCPSEGECALVLPYNDLMRRIARQIRWICASTSGLSLVEVLVAAAIVSIVSVMLVFALYTMGAIGKRSTDVVTDDAALSEEIAFGDEPPDSSITGEEITLSLDGGGTVTLPKVTFKTYTTEDGRSFTVFEYVPEPSAG